MQNQLEWTTGALLAPTPEHDMKIDYAFDVVVLFLVPRPFPPSFSFFLCQTSCRAGSDRAIMLPICDPSNSFSLSRNFCSFQDVSIQYAAHTHSARTYTQQCFPYLYFLIDLVAVVEYTIAFLREEKDSKESDMHFFLPSFPFLERVPHAKQHQIKE